MREEKPIVGIGKMNRDLVLNRSIGIAIVGVSIKVGDRVEVDHPGGTVSAEVTTIPFAPRGS